MNDRDAAPGHLEDEAGSMAQEQGRIKVPVARLHEAAVWSGGFPDIGVELNVEAPAGVMRYAVPQFKAPPSLANP
jgi:hypothetical protein